MYVAGVYRPPNKPVTDFTQFITRAMEYTNLFHTEFVGNFNIDVMSISNVTRTYIYTFHQYNLVNENNLSTYTSHSNGSAIPSIDHVWHNLNFPRSSYVVSPALSDHFAVFKVKQDSHLQTIRFRDLGDVNTERFVEKIDA